MSIKFNGAGYLKLPARLATVRPLTLMGWFAQTVNETESWLTQGNSAAVEFIGVEHSGSSLRVRGVHSIPGDGASVNNDNGPEPSSTMRLCVFVLTDTSNTIYWNNNAGVTNTDVRSPTYGNHDVFAIGVRPFNGTVDQYFNGSAAEVHAIAAALSAAQVATLLNDTVKPEALSGYIDGWMLKSASDLTSISGTRTLQVVGTVTDVGAAPHPISRSTPVPVSFSGPVPTRNGIVGTAASFANAGFFAGSQTPFAYTNVGSALPAGLTLSSSTGIISGTPTTAATTSGIIVRATDSSSNVANTNSYSIVIASSNAAPTFPGNISNISGTAGTAITPVNVSGQFSDTDTLTYTVSPAGTAWPSGLVVNSSTGIISGTVAGAGTTTGLKVRATDTASQTVDSNAFNAVIAAASATVTITSPSQGGKKVTDFTQRVSVACNVTALDKVTHAVLERKTGLTCSATGVVSFTSTVLTAGTERLFLVKADADDKDLGAFFATPV